MAPSSLPTKRRSSPSRAKASVGTLAVSTPKHRKGGPNVSQNNTLVSICTAAGQIDHPVLRLYNGAATAYQRRVPVVPENLVRGIVEP